MHRSLGTHGQHVTVPGAAAPTEGTCMPRATGTAEGLAGKPHLPP